MLKERTTYEIMRPEDVGFAKTDLVLGKHSGRAALADRAKTLGFRLTGEQLQQLFDEFKKLADKKKEIYDGDIVALIEQQLHGVVQEHWKLVGFEIISRTGDVPHVKLTLQNGGEAVTQEVTTGDGPVDAAFRAVEQITGLQLVCKDYQVRSATIGRDAQGEASLEIEHDGRSYRGLGVSTDTVEATIKALLNAVNRIVASQTLGAQRTGLRQRRRASRIASRSRQSAPCPWRPTSPRGHGDGCSCSVPGGRREMTHRLPMTTTHNTAVGTAQLRCTIRQYHTTFHVPRSK